MRRPCEHGWTYIADGRLTGIVRSIRWSCRKLGCALCGRGWTGGRRRRRCRCHEAALAAATVAASAAATAAPAAAVTERQGEPQPGRGAAWGGAACRGAAVG